MSRPCVAESLVCLDIDLPDAAEFIEVINIIRAEVNLQGVEDLADRYAQRCGTWCGRYRGRATGVLARQLLKRPCSPSALVGPGHDLVADPLECSETKVAAVLDDELEAAGRSEAIDRRCAEGRDDGLRAPPAGSASRSRDGDRVGRESGPAAWRTLRA